MAPCKSSTSASVGQSEDGCSSFAGPAAESAAATDTWIVRHLHDRFLRGLQCFDRVESSRSVGRAAAGLVSHDEHCEAFHLSGRIIPYAAAISVIATVGITHNRECRRNVLTICCGLTIGACRCGHGGMLF